MIRWLAPGAWLGIVALAVPVLVHLLSRDTARRLPFPSLRFLEMARLAPARRTRLTDPWLLLVRCAMLAAAVAALARPLWMTGERNAAVARWSARAVIVDTGTSMARLTASGEPAVVAARRTAALLADSASAALIIESAVPREALAGAIAWIEGRGGRGDIVVVSDFQTGTLDGADLAAVPAHMGVRMAPVAVTTELVPPPAAAGIPVVSSARDRAAADAAVQAARAVAGEPASPMIPVRIVFSEDTAPSSASPVSLSRAQIEFVARAERDPLLAGTGRGTWKAWRNSGDTLDIVVAAAPSSVAAAAIVAAVWRAAGDPRAPFESDPSVIPPAIVRGWDRAASAASPSTQAFDDESSDARWFWIAVLLLMMFETGVRRPRATPSTPA